MSAWIRGLTKLPPINLPSTTFGLYRDGTELRGVYYARPQVARLACSSLGVQCDYPVLLGNDLYYGGAIRADLIHR